MSPGSNTVSVQFCTKRASAANFVTKYRRTVGITLLEMVGDGGRIVHDQIVVDDHRHAASIGLRQLVLFSETPRYGLDLETFMGERHARAPAEGSEAAVRLGACEVVKGDRHVCRQVLSNKHFRKSAVCSENDYCCPPIATARPRSLSEQCQF